MYNFDFQSNNRMLRILTFARGIPRFDDEIDQS